MRRTYCSYNKYALRWDSICSLYVTNITDSTGSYVGNSPYRQIGEVTYKYKKEYVIFDDANCWPISELIEYSLPNDTLIRLYKEKMREDKINQVI